MEETPKIPNHWKKNWYFSKISTITERTYMFNLKMLIPNGFFFKKTSPKQVNICNQIGISSGNYLFS